MSSQKHVQIWHNPKCSKSRQTLLLLQEQNIEPEIIEYLKTPPSEEMLKHVLGLLSLAPRELMRTGETIYTELELASTTRSDDDLIKAMLENPILIERPIVINNQEKAIIGRPPESVLEIL